MTKEYPLRARTQYEGVFEEICECGHGKGHHDSDLVPTLGIMPTYEYKACLTCMCPKWSHEKTYTETLE